MINMHGNSRAARDAQHLGQLLHHVEAFATDMHAVVAAIALHDLGHFNNLFRTLRPFGVPRRGETERAFFHRLSDQPIHFLLLRRIGRALLKTANHALHLLGRNTGSDIDGNTAAPDRVEVARERRPIRFDAVSLAVLEAILLQDRALEGRHRLAFTDDIQGHALPHFAFGIAVGNDRLIAVRVHVDETRSYDIIFGGDSALAGLGIDLADGGDLARFDADVAVKPWVSCPLDHPAAMNHDIEISHDCLLNGLSVVAISPRLTPNKITSHHEFFLPDSKTDESRMW